MSSQGEFTRLLADADLGNAEARDLLVQRVYDELRSLARRYLDHERPDHTLEPTALVHEAYLRLVDQTRITWKNRAQFYSVAAQMMRRILVDHARMHRAAKRGHGARKVSITSAAPVGPGPDLDLVALDEALQKLEALDSRLSRVVELRFFGGLSIENVAKMLAVSTATVERHWSAARAWLFRELEGRRRDGSEAVAAD